MSDNEPKPAAPKGGKRPYSRPTVQITQFQRFFMVCAVGTKTCIGGPWKNKMKCL